MAAARWIGNTEDETGEAIFMIEGVEYKLTLDSFAKFRTIETMLEATFKQGKQFAAQAIRGHLDRAMKQAELQHAL